MGMGRNWVPQVLRSVVLTHTQMIPMLRLVRKGRSRESTSEILETLGHRRADATGWLHYEAF